VDLTLLPPPILRAILQTLRESSDASDYMLFLGRHEKGMNLKQLAERFGKSQERIRQRLNKLYERVEQKYAALYNPSGDYTVAIEETETT